MSDWLDAEAHADRALDMYERGRWAEAEAELRKAISLNPEQAEWHFNLGLTLEAAGRDADALESYEQAVKLLPGESEPLVAVGAVANRMGRYDLSVERLKRAVKLDPEHEGAYANLMDSLFRLGRHEEAETTFYLAQQALTESSAQCLAVMAESLLERSEYARAEWCLREAMRLEPSMPRLRARLAALAVATGKIQRAVQLYLSELREDPGAIDTLLDYGRLLRQMNRLPEAGEKFRRVLELEPANAEAHSELGKAALAEGRLDLAHVELELALKLDSQYPGIRIDLADVLLKRSQVEEARRVLLEEFDATVQSQEELQPGATPVRECEVEQADVRFADLLLRVDKPELASTLLRIACERHESPELLQQLALARFCAGDREEGCTISRRVLHSNPECVRSMHNLALAAFEENRLHVALGWVRRGLKIDRHDEELRRLRIRIWLAFTYRGLIWFFNYARATVASREWLKRSVRVRK